MRPSLETKALDHLHRLVSWNEDVLTPYVDVDEPEYDILRRIKGASFDAFLSRSTQKPAPESSHPPPSKP